MPQSSYMFTSESVSEGHPDKVCDRISDMVVDTYLSKDPLSRVACETLTTTNKVVLAGEIRGPSINKEEIISQVRECIKDIGYEQDGFHWKNCNIDYHLHEQSSDIAMGVDSGSNKDEGAGDQGIMFGFACNDTDTLMPAPIHYSHQILLKMAELRKDGSRKEFEPDSKSQITMQYQNGKLIDFERLSSKISKQALVSNIQNKKLKQNNLNEKIIRLLEQKLNNYAIKQEKINSELLSNTKGRIRDKSYLLSSNNRLLDSLNYKKTMNRGYAIIKDQDESIVESKKVANQHKLVNIMFSDGEITVRNQNDK